MSKQTHPFIGILVIELCLIGIAFAAPPDRLPLPVYSLQAGTWVVDPGQETRTMIITTTHPEAMLMYTTDGRPPNVDSSKPWGSPLSVALPIGQTALKAIQFIPYDPAATPKPIQSKVKSITYTIVAAKSSPSPTQTPTVTPTPTATATPTPTVTPTPIPGNILSAFYFGTPLDTVAPYIEQPDGTLDHRIELQNLRIGAVTKIRIEEAAGNVWEMPLNPLGNYGIFLNRTERVGWISFSQGAPLTVPFRIAVTYDNGITDTAETGPTPIPTPTVTPSPTPTPTPTPSPSPSPSPSPGATPPGVVGLKWDPSPTADVYYRIYHGPDSGSRDGHTDVGNVTEARATGLVPGSNYFFVVTARNSAELESEPSNEVSSVAITAPGPPAPATDLLEKTTPSPTPSKKKTKKKK
jgi:hypothetical protein